MSWTHVQVLLYSAPPPMPDPLDQHDPSFGRRHFLQAGAAGAFLCSIGGQKVVLGKRGDAAKADAAAARVQKPKSAEPTEQQTFTTPQPRPGGTKREYWIQATTTKWSIVPTKRDDWHGMAIPGKSTFVATVYQKMSEGCAAPIGPAAIPGPTLRAEVGDTIVVHLRNNLTELD